MEFIPQKCVKAGRINRLLAVNHFVCFGTNGLNSADIPLSNKQTNVVCFRCRKSIIFRVCQNCVAKTCLLET